MGAVVAFPSTFLAASASFPWIRRVSSFCRSAVTKVYSPVISRSLWPAIFDASMALPPTCCRHVMFALRNECGPSPGKSHPSACAAWCRASRTPESQRGLPGAAGDSAWDRYRRFRHVQRTQEPRSDALQAAKLQAKRSKVSIGMPWLSPATDNGISPILPQTEPPVSWEARKPGTGESPSRG